MRGAPALELLERVRGSPAGYPLLLAGGIAEREECAGARGRCEAAVAGTRFLLTEESRAHPEYRRRYSTPKRRSSPSCSAPAGRPHTG